MSERRKLVIEIDSGSLLCDHCRLLLLARGGTQGCSLFLPVIKIGDDPAVLPVRTLDVNREGKAFRCKECLDAERRLKKANHEQQRKSSSKVPQFDR